MNSVEMEWRKNNRKSASSFIDEMGNQGKCIRLRALYEQLWDAQAELIDRYRRYEQSKREDRPFIDRQFIASYIPALESRIERLKRQIRALLSEADGQRRNYRITQDMIDRAREYPIKNLIRNSGRNNVLCIAHHEQHPSMSLKGNRARCFTCGYFGDSIDVYMKINGTGFIEAVRTLQ